MNNFIKNSKLACGHFEVDMGLFTFIVLLNAFIFMGYCGADESDIENHPLNINIGHVIDSLSGVTPDEIKIAQKLLFETIFKKNYPNYTGTAILFSNMQSAVKAIKNKEIDGLGMMTLDYLLTRDENNLVPLRSAGLGHSAGSNLVLLVSGEKIQSITGLRDKKLILPSGGHGDVASMWIDTMLMRQSLPESDQYFNSVKRIEKSSRAVLKVFFGKVDACIVPRNAFDAMRELNPQVGTKLKVLHESPIFYMGIFGVVKGIDERKKQFFIKFIDELLNDKEGREILLMFKVQQISEFKPEYINSIESMYKQYKKLKAGER